MRLLKSILYLLVIVIMTGCAINNYIPDGKTILVSNEIVNDSTQYDISKSDVSGYIIQKPTKNLLGWMPRVWVYYKTKNKADKGKKFYKWLNTSVGVEPVYFDRNLTRNSRKQIENYLENTGYFNSTVESVKTDKNNRTKVVYTLKPAQPYIINEVSQKISDPAISKEVNNIDNESLVKAGDNYNVLTMDKERDQITSHLRDNGYFFFTKDNILYEVDTNLMQHKANVTLRIDGEKHDKYYINKVFVYPDYNSPTSIEGNNVDSTYSFSIRKNDPKYTYTFIYNKNHKKAPKINFKTFNQVIQIHDGEPFSQKKVSQTYRALGSLKLYRLSNISFDTIPSDNDTVKLLNCNITLQKGRIRNYTIQIEGTNSGGNLGGSASVSYRNYNVFRGAEVLNISIRYAIQAQKVMFGYNDDDLFTVHELGVEANVLFPRFLSPIVLRNFVSEYQPKTLLATGFNMQIRPLYMRYMGTASFGYNWKSTQMLEHHLTPLNFNLVRVLPSELFAMLLNYETNQRIKDQYTDHLIFGLNYSFILNTQDVKQTNDFFYLKFDVETSGNLLSLFNNTPLMTKSDEGYHEIFNIRYAQYLKFQFDPRYYHYFGNRSLLAWRFMCGIGISYGNSNDLPFEKSFYAGGTNDMRGWLFRTLGPGEFLNASGLDMEHIGDLLLETNIEYRFPIYSFIKGALFADIGNIWTLTDNESFPGGQFKFDKFYKQLAFDAGLGIRFDFSFFLLRLDMAVPMCDPALPEAHRWRVSKLQWSDIVWNFGIGYPF